MTTTSKLGTSGADHLVATENDQELYGLAGDDTLDGNGYSAWLVPGSGTNTIIGGSYADGNDVDYREAAGPMTINTVNGTATGPQNNDTLSGISGGRGSMFDDTITSGVTVYDGWEGWAGLGGNDTLDGGSGFDELRYNWDPAGVTVNLATGTATDGWGDTDTISNYEAIRGSRYDDVLTGSSADNERFRGLSGNDTIDGGGGDQDLLDYSKDANYGGSAGVTVNLATGTATDGWGDTDTISNIEYVRGTSQADSLTGDDLANILQGQGGNDTLDGGGGLDTAVFSGAADEYLVSVTGGTVTVTDMVAGRDGIDTLTSIENFYFRSGITLYDYTNHVTAVVSTQGVSIKPGAWHQLSGSAISASGGDPIVSYYLTDNDAGANSAVLWSSATGYIAQGDSLKVAAADIGTVWIRAGSDLGNQTFDVRAFDGTAWSDPASLTASIAANVAPVVTAPSARKALNEWSRLDSLFSVNDDNGDSITRYRLFDNNGDADSAYLWTGGGGQQAARTTLTVEADALSGVWLRAGSASGTDGVLISAYDGTAWSDWSTLSVTTASNWGTSGADHLVATENDQELYGLAGNDTLEGNGYIAWFVPGSGTNTIIGGSYVDGNDVDYRDAAGPMTINTVNGTATGPENNDTLSGISGGRGTMFDDTITSGVTVYDGWEGWAGLGGNDTLDGGSGFDELRYNWDPAGVTVNLATGTATDGWGDTDSFSNFEAIKGSRYDDLLTGSSAGGERFRGLSGNDTIDGGGGDNDILDYSKDANYGGNAGVTVNLATGTATDGWGDTDTISNIEYVRGTSQADNLTGDGLSNILQGRGGNDTLDGGGGTDTAVFSGAADEYLVSVSGGTVTVADMVAGRDGTDTVTGVENFYFSSGSRTVTLTEYTNNTLAVVATQGVSIKPGDWLQLSGSAISASDGDGDTITSYSLTDNDAGANSAALWSSATGYIAQGGSLKVAAADIGTVWIRAGSDVGNQTFGVRAFDGTAWSDPASLTASVATNVAPVVTAPSARKALNEWSRLDSLFSVNDDNGDSITRYRLFDNNGDADSAYLWTSGGGQQAARTTLTVEAGALSGVWLRAGSATGADGVLISAYDGTAWSDWSTLSVTSRSNTAPVVANATGSLRVDAWSRLSDLVSVTDADGDSIASYRLYDATNGNTTAQFWVSGQGYIGARSTTTVTAKLQDIWVKGGSSAGTDSLLIQANDGTDSGDWGTLTLTTAAANTAPVVQDATKTLVPGGWARLSELLSVTDADNDTITGFRIYEGNGTTGASVWTASKGYLSQGTTDLMVAASDIWVKGAASAGSETLWIKANDGSAWSTNWATLGVTTGAAPP